MTEKKSATTKTNSESKRPTKAPLSKKRMTKGADAKGVDTARAKKTVSKGDDGKRPIRADEAVMLRNEFYKDGSKKLKYLIIASSICLALSTFTAYVSVSQEGENNFFAVDESGQFVELITLDRPNHKAAVVSQWLTDALIDTFDFNYLNMKQVLNDKAMVWFTDSGRNSLITSIEESGSFSTIQKEKLITQLNLIRAPILVREGLNDSGRYEWLLQVEGKFTYTNETTVYTNNVIFTVSVIRRSMLEDVKGLGINKIIVEFAGK